MHLYSAFFTHQFALSVFPTPLWSSAAFGSGGVKQGESAKGSTYTFAELTLRTFEQITCPERS